MTRLERYRQKVAALEAKRGQLLRSGNLVKATALDRDISEIKRLISEAEEYEGKPIKEMLTEDEIHQSGIIPLIIECHLAADFLTDCAYMLRDSMKKLGFIPVTIIPELDEIIRHSDAFAAQMCGKTDKLRDMMVENDTLIAALHKKTVSYIEQRLKPRRRRKTKKDETERD